MTITFETRVSISLNRTNDRTVVLNAQTGNLTLGNHGQNGDNLLFDNNRVTRIQRDPSKHNLKVFDASGLYMTHGGCLAIEYLTLPILRNIGSGYFQCPSNG